jgi:hypothetical protein
MVSALETLVSKEIDPAPLQERLKGWVFSSLLIASLTTVTIAWLAFLWWVFLYVWGTIA